MQSWRMNATANKEGSEEITNEEEETTDEEAIKTDDTTTTIAVDAGTENRHRRDRVGCPRETWMKTDDRRTADSARGVE